MSRTALRATEPPVQWVPGVLFPEVKRDQGVTLTAHPHLGPRSRMSRSYTSSPLVAYVVVAGQLYFKTDKHLVEICGLVIIPKSFLSTACKWNMFRRQKH
jgi:hypothetical protein